jgi:hypothetical protein
VVLSAGRQVFHFKALLEKTEGEKVRQLRLPRDDLAAYGADYEVLPLLLSCPVLGITDLLCRLRWLGSES